MLAVFAHLGCKFILSNLKLTLPASAAVLIGCYDISLGLIGNFKSKNESYQDYLKNNDDDMFKDRARDCINKDDISKMS